MIPLEVEEVQRPPWLGGWGMPQPLKAPLARRGSRGRGVCHCISVQTYQSGESWLQTWEIIRGGVCKGLAGGSKHRHLLIKQEKRGSLLSEVAAKRAQEF